ncbi:MAG: AI-2E family transporter [Bacteroidales bacterium]|nr:AI-2E family transporter [Bacteroidales bacterium]
MNTSETLGNLVKKWHVWIFLISALALVFVAFSYFTLITISMIIAFVVSMIGKPLVLFLEKRCKIPNTWSCIITLLVFAGCFVGFWMLTVPLIAGQIKYFQQINFVELGSQLTIALSGIQDYLWRVGLMSQDQTLEQSIMIGINQLLNSIHLEVVFSNILSLLSSLFIGIFSVVFMSFFFLKDQALFHNALFLFVPERYEKQANNIIKNSRKLLTRYFTGLLIEVVSMMILLSTTMWLLGIENAILFGFLGGLLNIIPYLGPVIGAVLASVLGYTAALSGGFAPELIWIPIKVVIAFSVCNLFDNMVIQPMVYSRSVKAHPLEIFVVIMMAGAIAGIKGMILAIPVYTLGRIIAKEFFNHSKFVDKLTRLM